MTIEELLDCSADKLEKMTDEQLTLWFTPYFDVTRPERVAVKKMVEREKQKPAIPMTPERAEAFRLLASNGVDIAAIMRRKKK